MAYKGHYVEVHTPHFKTNVFCYSTGEGDPILFIHGWCHSSEIWFSIMERFVNSFHVIAIDLPGFGYSPPINEDKRNLSSYGKIVRYFISELGLDSSILTIVADSLGAI
jgi:pimeloyl-ACP methyl ester carboxylesterase